jgi:alpha-maltose-1-phosphate synthase
MLAIFCCFSKNNKREMNVIVAQPGKQHTQHLVYALQKKNLLKAFYTTVWYKSDNFPYTLLRILPGFVKRKIEAPLIKRSFKKINPEKVIQIPVLEIIRELTEKLLPEKYSEKNILRRDKYFDKIISKRICKTKADVIIGYEMACLNTFREAKENGMITILDLAQVHYNKIESISMIYPFFKILFKDHKLRREINEIKEQELKLADYIICLSEFAKESLISNGIPSKKIILTNLGFSPEDFLPKENYRQNGIFRIIFVGTITKRKGIDLIISAYRRLNLIRSELLFVGPPGDASDIIENNKEFIKYLPYVNHTKLSEILRQSDLFVLPSYLESWGMVVLEAMACGLPVIVSDNTGSKDAVIPECGFVIPTGNIEILAEKILFFYNNQDVTERMGKEARKRAEKYTWENYYNNVSAIIEEIDKNHKQKNVIRKTTTGSKKY